MCFTYIGKLLKSNKNIIGNCKDVYINENEVCENFKQ